MSLLVSALLAALASFSGIPAETSPSLPQLNGATHTGDAAIRRPQSGGGPVGKHPLHSGGGPVG
jgi:hypothetical protein